MSALAIGMDTIVQHLVAIVSVERVQVDYLQAIFFSHLLLDGDNLVGDDSVTDVPCRLKGRNGRAEEYLRTMLMNAANKWAIEKKNMNQPLL